MPAKYLMYPLWASGTSESVAGRVHHTYVAGLLNPCPSVRDLVVAGLQRRCPVPVAVDEAAVLVCRAAPEREYCLFSGTWAVCVCVCVCVHVRVHTSIRKDGSVFIRGDTFFHSGKRL